MNASGVLLLVLFATAPSDAEQEARGRFSRALTLFNEGRFEASLAEFDRAYAIAPAYQVLFNLAKVHARLGHSVEAADTAARFLNDGGTAISPERRAEAAALLAEQTARIGIIAVDLDVPDATVMLDGVDVATDPHTTTVRVASGNHSVGVRAPGYETARTSVRVAGGQTVRVALAPKPLSSWASIEISSPLEGVEVWVDGQSVGRTPLATSITVAPGERVVVGRRAGYTEARQQVALEANASSRLELRPFVRTDLTPDVQGTLRLHVPNVKASLQIDGTDHPFDPAAVLSLPEGPHRLVLRAAERDPLAARFVVTAGERLDMFPSLVWTPTARQRRVDDAASERTWGWALAGSAAALLGGGAGMFAWGHGEQRDLATQIDDLTLMAESSSCKMAEHDACFGPLSAQIDDKNNQRSTANVIRYAGAGVASAGLAAAILGVVLLAAADSEDDIDRAARVSATFGSDGAGAAIRF